MPVTDQDLFKLFVFLRRPIPWDPIPPWIKVAPDVAEKFSAAQARLNVRMAQLEAEKVHELGKIIGLPTVG